ncbi:alpha/beta hydrolase [Labedella populi]|uniref:Alpha/beta hydrolase n=1 Tax=Labedella populi TaxID=2498850 RepID=A0A3S3ZHH0_9MICO|nr:alpha/beta hydrolase [Labedella populi]RWZ59651.1 alpha/beta hydrolase [Labedella populi]
MAEGQWRDDVLGDDFEQLVLPLADDDEGEVRATLVRHRPRDSWARAVLHVGGPHPARGADVLYVHGWSDYFFQRELAEFWASTGARFHAVDLRKYGRSLLDHQTPGFVTSLETYDEDIEAALAAMGHGADDHPSRPLILMGHSSGGLTLSLWTDRHPGRVAALVLNSPWLEFQAHQFGRVALSLVLEMSVRVDPLGMLPNVDFGYYTRAVSSTMEGEWDYDLRWRPERGFRTHRAWLRAVLAGHASVAAGLSIDARVLTLVSARSTLQPQWSPLMLETDGVLDVADIARRSLQLAPTVTVARIEGALHDVMLSRRPVREHAKTEVRRWLRSALER